MLFSSKIRGIWREGDFIRIKAEYGAIKFHINEIKSIQLSDWGGNIYPLSALPLRRACAVFTLKSGRQKRLDCRRLTLRRYRWLFCLIEIEKHPEIEAARYDERRRK